MMDRFLGRYSIRNKNKPAENKRCCAVPCRAVQFSSSSSSSNSSSLCRTKILKLIRLGGWVGMFSVCVLCVRVFVFFTTTLTGMFVLSSRSVEAVFVF
mmetsp:Transcript_31357/g.75863  ORF Transcript_31357/g.75863 Transcript_31357/m.75863 type:complete len:98 (+) Transcript_31357:401-694(+)